jgi:aryl sulfotransferase
MGNIIWLASYPKSGNTWLRVFLINFQRDQDQPVNINELGGAPIASARSLFDEETGIKSSDLTPEEIECWRPAVFEHLSQSITEPIFMKIHDAFTLNAQGIPVISKAATRGAIYLIRNPLDVVLSYAHSAASSVDRVISQMGNPAARIAGDPKSLQDQLCQRLLTWSAHVRSWVDQPGLHVHVMRYEDVYRQPFETFQAAVRFAGLDDDAARIERALEHSSFSTLRQQERKHGFREKMPFTPSFFWQGRIGSWRQVLSEAQVTRLVQDHGEVMRRFGYLDVAGDVVVAGNLKREAEA